MKTHLIADETLGGVKREYVDVPERKADVGDYVHITSFENKEVSEIVKVTKISDDFDDDFHFTPELRGFMGELSAYFDGGFEECVTLEPTDIVQIDGQRYRLVERKAEVGEKVLAIIYEGDVTGISTGDVVICTECTYGDGSISVRHREDDCGFFDIEIGDEYRVLVPVEANELVGVDHSQASPEVVDLLANLARRVTSLEAQLKDTQRNIERQAEELESTRKCVLDGVKRSDVLESEFEGLAKITRANTDDIATLDERTQPRDKPFFTTHQPTFYFNSAKEPEELSKTIIAEITRLIESGGVSR